MCVLTTVFFLEISVFFVWLEHPHKTLQQKSFLNQASCYYAYHQYGSHSNAANIMPVTSTLAAKHGSLMLNLET